MTRQRQRKNRHRCYAGSCLEWPSRLFGNSSWCSTRLFGNSSWWSKKQDHRHRHRRCCCMKRKLRWTKCWRSSLMIMATATATAVAAASTIITTNSSSNTMWLISKTLRRGPDWNYKYRRGRWRNHGCRHWFCVTCSTNIVLGRSGNWHPKDSMSSPCRQPTIPLTRQVQSKWILRHDGRKNTITLTVTVTTTINWNWRSRCFLLIVTRVATAVLPKDDK